MKVSVIGAGYVGLVSGACLAEKGHRVICVDVDDAKVEKINRGIPPIYERDLEELLNNNIHGNLAATTDLAGAVIGTDLSFIAVGTPFDGEQIDLSYVRKAACDIGTALKAKKTYHVVVLKSTVVPGTTDGVVLPILEESSGQKAGFDFGVGMNPEFLKEGEAIHDFMHPDRIVLGGIDEKTLNMLEALYRPFEGVDTIRTNNSTAEMMKYSSNSLLATMISFSNEIGNLCAAMEGIDIVEVMKGVHLDRRLSPILSDGSRIVPSFTTYLEAGCGFGGSCFPKDVKALISHGKKHGKSMRLLEAVISINEQQPQQILSLLNKHFPSLRGIRLAVLGLAFKPGTDDMRESPAIPIVKSLLREDAEIKAYDPVAKDEAKKVFGDDGILYCDELDQAIKDVDAIVLLTRWQEFNSLPELISNIEPQPLLVDGRRMFARGSIEKYEGIGL